MHFNIELLINILVPSGARQQQTPQWLWLGSQYKDQEMQYEIVYIASNLEGFGEDKE